MVDLDSYVPKIIEGDADSFAYWVASAEPIIRNSLRQFATVVDVEAILQEALLRVWQVAPRYVPDGRPNGLLRLGIRIARNLAVSEARQTHSNPQHRKSLELALTQLEHNSLPGNDPLLRRRIEECRKLLPRRPAIALDQRLASGGAEPDAVLASRVKMSLNTFLQNVSRARRFLTECLKKLGVDLDSDLP